MKYPHIWRAVAEMPWAIIPERLLAMLEAVEARGPGRHQDDPPLSPRARGEEDFQEAAASAPRSTGGVAIIPIRGVIQQRPHWLEELFGIIVSASTERIGAQVAAAANDPAISTIVLEIDSPGGSVFGVPELWGQIHRARSQKPIVAVANSLAASAAYHIASAATEIVVTPSGLVGSIGVFTMHEDISGMAEQLGITVTLISAGKYKTEGNEFEPLGDEARAAIQKQVDEYYAMFTRDVARGRGVKVSAVTGGMGEGRVVSASDALKLGMADKVATLDETIARLAGAKGQRGGARAELASEPRSLGPCDECGAAAVYGSVDIQSADDGEGMLVHRAVGNPHLYCEAHCPDEARIDNRDSLEGPPTVPPCAGGEAADSQTETDDDRRRELVGRAYGVQR